MSNSKTVENKHDRLERRLKAALGGAILGTSVFSIMGGAIGHNTLVLQLAGAVLGFVAVYAVVSGEI